MITVITPTWNQAEFIEETIRSVVAQKDVRLEYLLFDNLSDDGTEEIVEKYRRDCPFLKYYRAADNGQADAINRGFSLASGDIVCWLNSDDFYLSDDVLSRVERLFYAHPEAYVLVGNGTYCDREGRHTEEILCNRQVSPGVLRRWNYLLQPAVFWKRNALRLDTSYRYAFDWKFFIGLQELSLRGAFPGQTRGADFLYTDEAFAAYRMYGENKTGQNNAARKKELYLLQKELGESRLNTAWCRFVWRVYETGSPAGIRAVDFGSRALFHLTGKRICSF